MRFRAASDQALLAYLGEGVGEDSHARVVRLLRALEHARPAWLRNLNPGYDSLLLTFDALAVSHAEVESELARVEREASAAPDPEPREAEISVCYGGEYGPDLDAVAAAHGMTPERVIEIHASGNYLAYFLGFVPGFAYLGEVAEAIATPRHATPRRSVPAGSVGIAARQTGVYPFATPGGWQLIGRTPLAMFRADRAPMSLIALGDRVRFRGITRQEFARLAEAEGVAASRESARGGAAAHDPVPGPTRTGPS